jgi:hypothetical protein
MADRRHCEQIATQSAAIMSNTTTVATSKSYGGAAARMRYAIPNYV